MNFRFDYDHDSKNGLLFLPNTTTLEGSRDEWKLFVDALRQRQTYSSDRIRVLRESLESKWELLLDASKYAHSDDDFCAINYEEADSIATEIWSNISDAAIAIHNICDRMVIDPDTAKKFADLEENIAIAKTKLQMLKALIH
jgi:hypothetical protein